MWNAQASAPTRKADGINPAAARAARTTGPQKAVEEVVERYGAGMELTLLEPRARAEDQGDVRAEAERDRHPPPGGAIGNGGDDRGEERDREQRVGGPAPAADRMSECRMHGSLPAS
jgi:hypothetical protein